MITAELAAENVKAGDVAFLGDRYWCSKGFPLGLSCILVCSYLRDKSENSYDAVKRRSERSKEMSKGGFKRSADPMIQKAPDSMNFVYRVSK